MIGNANANGTPFDRIAGGLPPAINNLIAWDFKTGFGTSTDDLSSKDYVNDSDEPAKFVSSYCANFIGDGAKYMVTPFGVGTGTNWTFECEIITRPASFSAPACLVAMAAGGVQIYAGTTGGAWGYYDGALYNANTALSLDTKYTLKVVRNGTSLSFFINGVADGTPTISTSINSTYYRFGSQLDGNNPWTGRLIWAKFQTAGVTVGEYYFSGGYFDISGNGNHLTNTNTSLRGLQDYAHRNINFGCDIYSLDSAPTDRTKDIYVPYKDGAPVVTSLSGYTKIKTCPAGYWHNGCETKIVVGTNGTKDANGWQAYTDARYTTGAFKTNAGVIKTVAQADPNEILISRTTAPIGYCKEIDLNTADPVQAGYYIIFDNTEPTKIKNFLWWSGDGEPTNDASANALKFVRKTDFILSDEGAYLTDDDGHVLCVT